MRWLELRRALEFRGGFDSAHTQEYGAGTGSRGLEFWRGLTFRGGLVFRHGLGFRRRLEFRHVVKRTHGVMAKLWYNVQHGLEFTHGFESGGGF